MSRPRAGHGRTLCADGWRIMDVHGNFLPTLAAKGWPRCDRCRKPEQWEGIQLSISGKKLCPDCFYYKQGLGPDWFQSRKNDYLFPYNIGARTMNAVIAALEARGATLQ